MGERAADGGKAPSVLWKAFDVLGAFSHRRRVLSLAEIARHSGLPKSTAHRVLAMLVEIGAVEQAGDGYQVGLRMFSLGVLPPEAALREAALPHLEELHRVTGQTLHLAILRDADVVYLEKLLPRGNRLVTPSVIGDRMPAVCTGVGKALLAFSADDVTEAALAGPLPRRTARSAGSLEQIRAQLKTVRGQGYAFDREETADGLACVAVPVLAATPVPGVPGGRGVPAGRAVAAISVSFPANAGTGQSLVAPLRETAAAISRSLVRRVAADALAHGLRRRLNHCPWPGFLVTDEVLAEEFVPELMDLAGLAQHSTLAGVVEEPHQVPGEIAAQGQDLGQFRCHWPRGAEPPDPDRLAGPQRPGSRLFRPLVEARGGQVVLRTAPRPVRFGGTLPPAMFAHLGVDRRRGQSQHHRPREPQIRLPGDRQVSGRDVGDRGEQ